MKNTVSAGGLVGRLKDRQGATGNAEFAASIGLSRQMWEAVLRGDKRIGLASLSRIGRRHPELAGAVLDYVLDARNTE